MYERSPLDLGSKDEIIGSFEQPNGNGAIIGMIVVAGVVFLYLVGLFYEGIGALFQRPPIRVVGTALGVSALSFIAIHDGPSHGDHWLLACTLSPALGLCCIGLWSRHQKRQIRRAKGIPSTWQVESERVSRDLGRSIKRNAGAAKGWWDSL
jgi:hypothetical protein